MAKARGVTSYEVADAAGVSQAVVSSVLSGARGTIRVSDATRQRILRVAKELGYTANHAARSLSRRRTSIIAVVTYNLDNPYYADIVAGACTVARANAYSVSVVSLELDHPADKRQLVTQLHSGVYDGVLDTRTHDRADVDVLADLLQRGVPAVTTWRWDTDGRVPAVGVDVEGGAYQATRHLLDLGHARIGHLSEPGTAVRDAGHPVGARFAGYRRALAETGVAFEAELLIQAPNSLDGAAHAARELAALPSARRPTAVFAFNDVMALGVLHGLRRAGLNVPGDVAVVGFDGLSWGAVSHPTLTTVEYPRQELGRQATEMLFELIGDEPVRERDVLRTEFVIRGSCGGAGSRET